MRGRFGAARRLAKAVVAHAGRRPAVHTATGESIRMQGLHDLHRPMPAQPPSSQPQSAPAPLPGVKHIIAIASGKGGVGKSTVTANLALALLAQGLRVGVLDADIYGPSQPILLGVRGERPLSHDGQHGEPVMAHGLQTMSVGFLVDEAEPMIWRGPMVTQGLHKLLFDTRWDALDFLLIDLPPGTGDVQLSLAQRIPITGAIIITTPQELALVDARKGLKMFEKVSIPVLGIVENMATHVCSHCGQHEDVFGSGGGQRLADECDVPLLGRLPLDGSIRAHADGGTPSVVAEPQGTAAQAYLAVADAVLAQMDGLSASAGFPTITMED